MTNRNSQDTNPLATTYETVLLPEQPSSADLRRVIPPYQAMILTQFDAILDRTERSAYYPWVDTKLNIITGQDFPSDDPLRGPTTITAWIQGRALESLVGYTLWLQRHGGAEPTAARRERALRVAAPLMQRLLQAKAAGNGHLGFFMTPDGHPFTLDVDLQRHPVDLTPLSPYTYNDLFAAKGIFLAAHILGDAHALREARAYCLATAEAILARRFVSGQPQLSRTGTPVDVPGKHSHGPAMIALGMAALFARYEPGPDAIGMGIRLARFILDQHVNVEGRFPKLLPFDVVEYLDDAGRPFVDDAGRVLSDPGHALEYVGLYLQFSANARRYGIPTPEQHRQLDHLDAMMPAILARNFANGFRPDAGGICKSFDVLGRTFIDASMPWWSLPETIRSAIACWSLDPEGSNGAAARRVVAACHNAFVTHFVRPEVHCMAVQTRAADGSVVDSIPATPDADPGYHTALSLIDALNIMAGT